MSAAMHPSVAPDGVYGALMSNGSRIRVERRDGVWHLADGTGWSEPMNDVHRIVEVEDIRGRPQIDKDYDYGPLTYPLTLMVGR